MTAAPPGHGSSLVFTGQGLKVGGTSRPPADEGHEEHEEHPLPDNSAVSAAKKRFASMLEVGRSLGACGTVHGSWCGGYGSWCEMSCVVCVGHGPNQIQRVELPDEVQSASSVLWHRLASGDCHSKNRATSQRSRVSNGLTHDEYAAGTSGQGREACKEGQTGHEDDKQMHRQTAKGFGVSRLICDQDLCAQVRAIIDTSCSMPHTCPTSPHA